MTRKQEAAKIAKALTMSTKAVAHALKTDSVAFEDYILALRITLQQAEQHYSSRPIR